jgi:hypothetical protein
VEKHKRATNSQSRMIPERQLRRRDPFVKLVILSEVRRMPNEVEGPHSVEIENGPARSSLDTFAANGTDRAQNN